MPAGLPALTGPWMRCYNALGARLRRPLASLGWALLICVAAALPSPASAADEPRDIAGEAQREQLAQWRRSLNQRADVLTPQGVQAWIEPMAGESPCFQLSTIAWLPGEGVADLGPGLLGNLGRYADRCLGPRSIEALRTNLEARLVAQGLVTTTIEVPAQNLADGVLLLRLHLGRIDSVVIEPGAATGTSLPSVQALGLRPGAVLNLRQIEQALENLARLPSQAARFRIEPGLQPGSSRIVILPAGGPRWHASLGAETTEVADYGPWALSGSVTLDAPLGLSDQISLVASLGSRREADGDSPRQTSLLLNYSLPWGPHLWTANLSHSAHQRSIQGGVGRFADSGAEWLAQARWTWTAWRNQDARLSLWAGATARRSQAFVEGIELLLQRRESSSADLGLALWHRLGCGDASAEAELSRTQHLARDEAFQAPVERLPETWRLQLQWRCGLAAALRPPTPQPTSADDSQAPAGPASTPWEWQGRLWVQGASHPAGPVDLSSIGGRWTVRGHAARLSLSGAGAVVLRQEWLPPPLALGPSAGWRGFVALDHGRLLQTSPADGPRRSLSGLALGARWQWGPVSGELLAARPVLRHAGDSEGVLVQGSLNIGF